jgi:hypothetical protein
MEKSKEVAVTHAALVVASKPLQRVLESMLASTGFK